MTPPKVKRVIVNHKYYSEVRDNKGRFITRKKWTQQTNNTYWKTQYTPKEDKQKEQQKDKQQQKDNMIDHSLTVTHTGKYSSSKGRSYHDIHWEVRLHVNCQYPLSGWGTVDKQIEKYLTSTELWGDCYDLMTQVYGLPEIGYDQHSGIDRSSINFFRGNPIIEVTLSVNTFAHFTPKNIPTQAFTQHVKNRILSVIDTWLQH